MRCTCSPEGTKSKTEMGDEDKVKRREYVGLAIPLNVNVNANVEVYSLKSQ